MVKKLILNCNINIVDELNVILYHQRECNFRLCEAKILGLLKNLQNIKECEIK